MMACRIVQLRGGNPMNGKRGMFVLLAIMTLMAASGVTTLTTTSQPALQGETLAAPTPDTQPSDSCALASVLASSGDDSDKNKPPCCSTQCNVDKDCDRICGKGNCACLQENPCCRRCVY